MLKSVLKAFGRKITGCKERENPVTVLGEVQPCREVVQQRLRVAILRIAP